MSLIKSEEQEVIVEAAKQMSSGEILKIDASAGCAKTSTLCMVAEAIEENSLCLVFNKSAQEDAAKRFPSHVECRTTHSLAYRAEGVKIAHKLSRPQGGYVNVLGTGNEIAKYFGIQKFEFKDGQKDLPPAFIGLLIRNTCNKFEQSAYDKITSKCHLEQIKDYTGSGATELKKLILDHAKKLWALRINPEAEVLATHDTYLKMYQLSNPQLNHSTIYLDESQDSNECVLDIITKQKNAKVIVVGDSRQAIYGWRGAVNALNKVKGKSLKLSTTFRYGSDVAELAAKILDDGTKITSFSGLNTEVGEDKVDKTKPYTVLYRTNEKLVLDAVDAISKGLDVNLEIDVRDFCNLLNSALALYKGDMSKVKHEELLCYNSFAEFKEESESNSAFERIVSIIESNRCWKVLKALQEHHNNPKAHITFTTAHKSKGREWEQVELANDFPSNLKGSEWVGLSEEEQNLLYVASTRAKKALNINKTVKEIWYKDLMDKKGLELRVKQMGGI
jgi:superfamily I DNA/RNA helicase